MGLNRTINGERAASFSNSKPALFGSLKKAIAVLKKSGDRFPAGTGEKIVTVLSRMHRSRREPGPRESTP